MTAAVKCRTCERGQEACQYCAGFEPIDFEVCCDCGLYDFGEHLTDCTRRDGFYYVIAADHDAARIPRTV